MPVAVAARGQVIDERTTLGGSNVGFPAASAGNLIIRLIITDNDSASFSAPTGFTQLASGSLSSHGSGPGKFAIYGKIAVGGETDAPVGGAIGENVNVAYVVSGHYPTLASALSAYNFVAGASFSDNSWPTVAGATASILKSGSLAIFGAWAWNPLVTSAWTTVGSFGPPNELETAGNDTGEGAVSTGYSTGLSVGTTTAHPVSGNPGFGDYGRRGTFVLVIRPANTAPGAPGAITAPAVGTSYNTVHPVTHGAAVDPETDTLTYRAELSTDNGASWNHVLFTARSGVTGNVDFTLIPATSSAKIRIRSTDTEGLTSGWTEMPGVFTIQHNTAPTAATPVSPVGGITVDRTAVSLVWEFNDPDAGDSPSRADIRYRDVGSGVWTTVLNAVTTATSYNIPSPLTAGDKEWQVKTYDASGLEGVWTSSAFFTAADVPNPPTITSHGVDEIIPTSSDSLAWSGAGTSIQARRVADDGGNPNLEIVYEDSGVVTPGTLDWPFSFPVNNRTEHLQVRRLVSGLWSDYASVRVLVSYTAPVTPVAAVSVHQVEGLDAALLITITNPSEG